MKNLPFAKHLTCAKFVVRKDPPFGIERGNVCETSLVQERERPLLIMTAERFFHHLHDIIHMTLSIDRPGYA